MKESFCRIKYLIIILVCVLCAGAFPASGEVGNAPGPDSPEFPAYVMQKIDDQHRGEKSHGVMEMKIKTEHWTRSLKLESWSLGTKYSLVRILAPKKEKGTATLKAKKDLFTYLSKTRKTIKITSGMMGGAWMGSHFTNDDLIRESRFSEDFKIKLIFKGEKKGVEVYRFRLTPKPDTPVVWGKITVTVRRSDLQPLRQIYFDEEGKKVRMLKFSDHKEMDGRVIPTTMVMKPLDDSGEYTKITMKKLDFSVKLDKSFFTVQKLKSL